jgi:hypothetical protein
MIRSWRSNDEQRPASAGFHRLDTAQAMADDSTNGGRIQAARLRAGDSPTYSLENDRVAWLIVASGHLFACGTELRGGDVAQLEGEPLIALYAETESLVLLLDLPRTRSRGATP